MVILIEKRLGVKLPVMDDLGWCEIEDFTPLSGQPSSSGNDWGVRLPVVDDLGWFELEDLASLSGQASLLVELPVPTLRHGSFLESGNTANLIHAWNEFK